MAKSKKKAKPSAFSIFSKRQMVVAAVFVLIFGGFGIYKLAFSSAATYQNRCRTRYLKLGDSGNCVKYLQDALNGSGSRPIVIVNGKFGATTHASVVYMQNAKGYINNPSWGEADGRGVAGPDFAGRMCAGSFPIDYCIR